MNVSAGRHPEPTLQSRSQVGDDVAKHVVRHDHVELAGITHHLHAERIHVHVRRLDLRIFPAYFLEHALPQPARMRHGIRFVAHQHARACTSVQFFMLLTIVERIADHALHSLTSVDIFLDRDFVFCSLLENSTDIAIDPLGVLAYDDEVHPTRLNALQWTEGRIQQSHRTHVRIQIHLEPHSQQDFLGMNVGGNARIAEGADQNGIEFALQHGKAIGWNGYTVGEVARGAPVELGGLDGSPGGHHHLHGLWNHLAPNPVAGKNGNLFCGSHEERAYQLPDAFAIRTPDEHLT